MHIYAYASMCILSRSAELRCGRLSARRLHETSKTSAEALETSMTATGLERWYGYMKSHDRAALWDLLHPDAVFESPVVHTPQRGRDITPFDADGRITHFKVMVRPLKAINLLHRLMGEQLAKP